MLTTFESNIILFPTNSVKKTSIFLIAEVINTKGDKEKKKGVGWGRRRRDANLNDGKIKPLILTFIVLPWMTKENPVSDAE